MMISTRGLALLFLEAYLECDQQETAAILDRLDSLICQRLPFVATATAEAVCEGSLPRIDATAIAVARLLGHR